jgi:hypothetical protein
MVKSIDFSRGTRGMFANRKISVVGAVDSAPQKPAGRRHANAPLVVAIDDDLLAHFPTEEAVNEALRLLVTEINRNKPHGRQQA